MRSKNWHKQVFIDPQENDLPQLHVNKPETSGNKGRRVRQRDQKSAPGAAPASFSSDEVQVEAKERPVVMMKGQGLS